MNRFAGRTPRLPTDGQCWGRDLRSFSLGKARRSLEHGLRRGDPRGPEPAPEVGNPRVPERAPVGRPRRLLRLPSSSAAGDHGRAGGAISPSPKRRARSSAARRSVCLPARLRVRGAGVATLSRTPEAGPALTNPRVQPCAAPTQGPVGFPRRQPWSPAVSASGASRRWRHSSSRSPAVFNPQT